MSIYVGNARERIVQLTTPTRLLVGDWVANGVPRTVAPHITLSPRTSRGLPTSGLALTLIAPSAGAADPTAPGFSITIFRTLPTLGMWTALQTFTGANYLDQLVLPDISGGMGLFFDISNINTDGLVLIGLAELD